MNIIKKEIPDQSFYPAVGDVDNLICRIGKHNLYCFFASEPNSKIDNLLLKMLVDNDALPAPMIDSFQDETEEKLMHYYSTCPTIGIFYVRTENKLINCSRKMLNKFWRQIFKKNTLYEILFPRYSHFTQPLLEIHRNAEIIEKLQHKIYKRCTAFTHSLVCANLVACSFYLHCNIKAVRPPRLVFCSL